MLIDSQEKVQMWLACSMLTYNKLEFIELITNRCHRSHTTEGRPKVCGSELGFVVVVVFILPGCTPLETKGE